MRTPTVTDGQIHYGYAGKCAVTSTARTFATYHHSLDTSVAHPKALGLQCAVTSIAS